MSIRYNVSPWISAFPSSRRTAFARFRGDAQADVAVVGGGLTGMAVAYACATVGMKPLVLEADRIGAGTTALESGLLLPEPGPSFRDVVGTHGLRTGKRVFLTWRRAALDAAALLRRLNIRCGLDSRDSVVAAAGESEKLLRREYEARVDAGLDLSWMTERHARGLTRTDHACATRQNGAFALDPFRAALGLAAAARARGAVIHEASAVRRIRVTRSHAEVTCARGTLRAGTVIVTTGGPTDLFPSLERHFTVRDTYHVLTDVMPLAMRRLASVPTATVRDMHVPPHRLLWTADHRALVSGAEQAEAEPRRRDTLVREWTFELMYELLKMYPAISGLQPSHGWRRSSATTKDGLPFIGPHRNYPRHLFALGGWADASVTGAFLAARVLLRTLAGESEPVDESFGFTR